MSKTKQRPLPPKIKVNLPETLTLPLTFQKASSGKYYYSGIKMKNINSPTGYYNFKIEIAKGNKVGSEAG